MKSISTVLLLILIPLSGIKAQKPILVSEDSLLIGNNRLPGLSIIIPEVEYEKTLNNWIKELQSGTRSTVVTDNGEMSIFGASLKSITENPVNVYSKLIDRDSVLNLAVTIEMKKDLYVERATGEAEVARAKSYLFNFAKTQYIDLVTEEVKAEKDKLKDIEKELGSLEKDQSGMQKSIRSGNKRVSSEKDRLVVLNNELTTLSVAIIEHNNQLNTMEAGDIRDEKVKYIKDLEKQKKRTKKAISSSENRISKADRSINNANRAIPRIDNTQERTRTRITDQEAVVQRFVDKLNTIKAYK
jgi:predicted  nucleic acid-binding Zn-ribbon protein